MDQKIQTLYDTLAAGTLKKVTVNDLFKLCAGKRMLFYKESNSR